MESLARTPSGTDRLLRLNQPQPAEVVCGADGLPQALRVGRRSIRVARILDAWAVEDGWWTLFPVDRFYCTVALNDGRMLTLYCDRHNRSWWAQRY